MEINQIIWSYIVNFQSYYPRLRAIHLHHVHISYCVIWLSYRRSTLLRLLLLLRYGTVCILECEYPKNYRTNVWTPKYQTVCILTRIGILGSALYRRDFRRNRPARKWRTSSSLSMFVCVAPAVSSQAVC